MRYDEAMAPNQPKTPQRSIRIPDDTWHKAQEIAAGNGDTLSDVIRVALERYIKKGIKR